MCGLGKGHSGASFFWTFWFFRPIALPSLQPRKMWFFGQVFLCLMLVPCIIPLQIELGSRNFMCKFRRGPRCALRGVGYWVFRPIGPAHSLKNMVLRWFSADFIVSRRKILNLKASPYKRVKSALSAINLKLIQNVGLEVKPSQKNFWLDPLTPARIIWP